MPIKWNLYRILLIAYMLLSLTIVIFVIVIQAQNKNPPGDTLTSLVMIVMALILFFNGFINYLWLHHYYPSQLPSRGFQRVTRILQWSSLPILILYVFFSLSSFYSFFEAQLSIIGSNVYYILATTLMLILSISGLLSFFLQFSLVRTIKKNQGAAYEDFMK